MLSRGPSASAPCGVSAGSVAAGLGGALGVTGGLGTTTTIVGLGGTGGGAWPCVRVAVLVFGSRRPGTGFPGSPTAVCCCSPSGFAAGVGRCDLGPVPCSASGLAATSGLAAGAGFGAGDGLPGRLH